MNHPNFPENDQTLAEFYQQACETVQQSTPAFSDLFASYTHERLLQPAEWFHALAVCELAVDTAFDLPQTETFFQHIFRGYDAHVSFYLNEEDYRFFWERIGQLFEKLAPLSSEAIVEQALQYYSPRRPYTDRSQTLKFLQEATERGNEKAAIFLGYDYYLGLSGVTDKEKGLQLIDSVQTPGAQQQARLYKNYIQLYEKGAKEAHESINALFAEEMKPVLQRQVREQMAFLLELEGKHEEAFAHYSDILKQYCAGFSAMHAGILHYNRLIEGADQREGLRLLELSFSYGRPEVGRSLFYCYFQSGQEWQNNERGIYWLHKGYQYCDPNSTYELASLHLFYDEYKDIEKGLAYLDEAVALNQVDAWACKGYIYHRGEWIERDIAKSVELLTKAIEMGSGYAAYQLGIIHEEGLLTNNEPDYPSALACYEKSAEMGYLYGYDQAGRYLLNGYVGEADLEKAFNYFKSGAEVGSAYCKTQLGFCYRRGWGTDENPDEAVRYLQLSAEENMPDGLTELALCYEQGYGVEENGKKALEYMLRAAELQYVYAQYKVGCYYLYGLEGVATDYGESFKWMLPAAEAGYSYAQLEMGDYYLWDYADSGETQKAYEYYVKAAAQDCVNEGIGTCLEYGIGVEENEGEAFKYYLKAAEEGYMRAMYHTGRCYYYGYGVKENYNEAFRWFNDAAGHEFIPAIYYKGKMLLAGEGCMQNLEEGIALLRQAAENELGEAQFLLGNCYLVGKGVDPDDDTAMEWFERAADNGHEQAQKVTGRRVRE